MITSVLHSIDKVIAIGGARTVLLVTQRFDRSPEERNERTGKLELRFKLRNREDAAVNRLSYAGIKVTDILHTELEKAPQVLNEKPDLVVVAGEEMSQSFAIAARVRALSPSLRIAIEFFEETYGPATHRAIIKTAERFKTSDLLAQLVYLTAQPQSPRRLVFDVDHNVELRVTGPMARSAIELPSPGTGKTGPANTPPKKRIRFVKPEANFPEVVDQPSRFAEGAVQTVTVNRYERDPKARRACLRHHGYACAACGFNFEKTYGDIGIGFIHVHHRKPLSAARASYQVDPKDDLVPVCPNCHAMLHSRRPILELDELKAVIHAQRFGPE